MQPDSSALALIADVLPEGAIEQIRKNLLSPPIDRPNPVTLGTILL